MGHQAPQPCGGRVRRFRRRDAGISPPGWRSSGAEGKLKFESLSEFIFTACPNIAVEMLPVDNSSEFAALVLSPR